MSALFFAGLASLYSLIVVEVAAARGTATATPTPGSDGLDETVDATNQSDDG